MSTQQDISEHTGRPKNGRYPMRSGHILNGYMGNIVIAQFCVR